MTTTNDLATRLAEARRAEEPLSQRLREIDEGLADALARSDYEAAAQFRDQQHPARQELLIAAATTKALAEAMGVVEQQQAEVDRQIQLQRQRDEARAGYETNRVAEQDALDLVERHMAAVKAGLTAVRESLEAALAAEWDAGNARAAAYQCLVTLGEREGGKVSRPNAVESRVQTDPLLRAVRNYRG